MLIMFFLCRFEEKGIYELLHPGPAQCTVSRAVGPRRPVPSLEVLFVSNSLKYLQYEVYVPFVDPESFPEYKKCTVLAYLTYMIGGQQRDSVKDLTYLNSAG